MRPPHEPSLSAFPYQLDSTKRISWNGRDLSARFNARISLQCPSLAALHGRSLASCTQIDYISVCLTVIRLKMIVITCFSLATRVQVATGIMARVPPEIGDSIVAIQARCLQWSLMASDFLAKVQRERQVLRY